MLVVEAAVVWWGVLLDTDLAQNPSALVDRCVLLQLEMLITQRLEDRELS